MLVAAGVRVGPPTVEDKERGFEMISAILEIWPDTVSAGSDVG